MVYTTPVGTCAGNPVTSAPSYTVNFYKDQISGVFNYSASFTAGAGISFYQINAVTNNNGARVATKIGGGAPVGGGVTNISVSGTSSQAVAAGGMGIEIQLVDNSGAQYVFGGGAVNGASWGGPPVAGGSSTSGGTTGGTTAGGSISIGTPQTQSDPTTDPNAPSWWSWLWTAIKWALVPSQAGIQNFTNSVTALGQAGPMGVGTAMKNAASTCSASDGVSAMMPDSMAVNVAGIGAVTVDSPWKGWAAGHGPATGASTSVRSMLKYILWLSVAMLLLKWLRGKLNI
jgi:hypothetical protein